MNIAGIIVEWFKNFFNIQPEKKTIEELESDFFETTGISITNTMANRIATLATVDSTAEVIGTSKRAEFLNNYLCWIVRNKLKGIGQISLGTGDCLVRPNTNGKRLGVDIIHNGNFIIVESVGDFLISVLIRCAVIKKGANTYERWEYHKLDEDNNGIPYVSITQVAFKNSKRISISDVDAWANLVEVQYVPNADRLLLGRFKCPTLNRKDINSDNGVPITFGNEHVVEEIKESYKRFNEEFSKTEPIIFADKRIFKSKRTVKGGKTVEVTTLPKGKERVITNVSSNNIDGTPLIKEWAPAIRDASLETNIERNFRMLELLCGFSEGILSKSTLTYTNTDEVKKSLQATYAFITNFRNTLEEGLTNVIYAADVICNYNNITPMGDYKLDFDWSDSFVQSMKERFNELLQGANMDVIAKAELRSWIQNEPLEISEEKIKEMENSSEDIDDDM